MIIGLFCLNSDFVFQFLDSSFQIHVISIQGSVNFHFNGIQTDSDFTKAFIYTVKAFINTVKPLVYGLKTLGHHCGQFCLAPSNYFYQNFLCYGFIICFFHTISFLRDYLTLVSPISFLADLYYKIAKNDCQFNTLRNPLREIYYKKRESNWSNG